MYNDKSEITINVVIEYDYDEEMIKSVIKQLIDLRGVKKIEIEDKKR